jgi:hypothetical protein
MMTWQVFSYYNTKGVTALVPDVSVLRWTSPSLQRMNCLVIGNGQRRIVVQLGGDTLLTPTA